MRATLSSVMALTGLLTLSPVFTTSSFSQTPISGGNTSITRMPDRSLEASIVTDRTQYGPNRAVQVTMNLTNLNSNQHVLVPGQAYQYDFTVRDVRTNQAVFTLSKNRPRLLKEAFTINGNDTRTYQELWDQTDDTGKRVTPGVYVIEASIYPQSKVSTQIFLADRDGTPRDPTPRPRPEPGDPTPGRRRLSSTLTSDQSAVAPGATVNFTYTVQNGTGEPLNLRFSSGKRFDTAVIAANGVTVWQMSQEMSYTQALGQLTIAPNQKQTFTASWRVPADLAPGQYAVYSFLTPMDARGKAYLPASALLTIGNGGSNGNDNVIGGGEGSFNGSLFIQGTSQVSVRILVSAAGSRYVGQKVMVIGKYNGHEGGYGTPPVSKNDWVLGAEGVTMYVTGRTPSLAVGSNVSVTGTVRQTADGRTYLEVN